LQNVALHESLHRIEDQLMVGSTDWSPSHVYSPPHEPMLRAFASRPSRKSGLQNVALQRKSTPDRGTAYGWLDGLKSIARLQPAPRARIAPFRVQAVQEIRLAECGPARKSTPDRGTAYGWLDGL